MLQATLELCTITQRILQGNGSEVNNPRSEINVFIIKQVLAACVVDAKDSFFYIDLTEQLW